MHKSHGRGGVAPSGEDCELARCYRDDVRPPSVPDSCQPGDPFMFAVFLSGLCALAHTFPQRCNHGARTGWPAWRTFTHVNVCSANTRLLGAWPVSGGGPVEEASLSLCSTRRRRGKLISSFSS